MPLGKREDRTRVTCNLPVRNAAEEKAFKQVIAYVQQQRAKEIGLDGYTYSRPGTFYGYWWDTDISDWVEDDIVLLILDYKIAFGDPKSLSLSEQIATLKLKIHECYDHYGSPQQEVWIIVAAQPVHRYVDLPTKPDEGEKEISPVSPPSEL